MAEPDQVFCKFCGEKIDADCVVCPHCGKQVKDLKSEQTQPQIVINNANNNSNTNVNAGIAPGCRMVNKWVSFWLCVFLGYLGAHKFYEGKIGMGILYMCTAGLFGIGWILDIFTILAKPNPYAVY